MLEICQEIAKIPNIPAIAQGEKMLAAIQDLQNRLASIEERLTNLENQGASECDLLRTDPPSYSQPGSGG